MNPVFQKLVIKVAQQRLRGKKVPPARFQQEVKLLNIEFTYFFRQLLLISLGILSAGFGLRGFLLPNAFIDGGVTGISLLVEVVTGWPFSILLVAINLPFLILGFRTISPAFAVKSILAIVALAAVVHLLHYPTVTEDKLLIAVFGGFFLGLGSGLAVRGGAVIDGTEVLAIFMSKKTGLSIGDIILVFNIIIFSFAAYILSIETALYAILTYLAASKTVDFVIDGIEEYIGVTIISPYHEKIREAIVKHLGRGCTIYNGRGGYEAESEPVEILYTVITRLEMARLRKEVDLVDPDAFMIVNVVQDTRGGMVKKRPLQH